jgi:tetratricopeptide (TPR) repeat protein
MNLSKLKLMSIAALSFVMLSNCTSKKQGDNTARVDSLRADSLKKAKEKAEPVLQTAAEYYDRASAKSDSGNCEGAIADYTKALELDPNDSYSYWGRGYCKRKLKNPDNEGAIEDYTKGLAIDSTVSGLYSNRAYAYADIKNFPAAIADYGKAIEFIKDDTDEEAQLYNYRGLIELQTGDKKAAIKDFKMAKNLKPLVTEYSDNLKEAEGKK